MHFNVTQNREIKTQEGGRVWTKTYIGVLRSEGQTEKTTRWSFSQKMVHAIVARKIEQKTPKTPFFSEPYGATWRQAEEVGEQIAENSSKYRASERLKTSRRRAGLTLHPIIDVRGRCNRGYGA